MLWVALALLHLANHTRRGHANLLAPGHQPFRAPLRMRPVRFWHVLIDRGEAAPPNASCVAAHPLRPVQDLQCGAGHSHLQRLTHQRVRHAVAVAFKLNVLINVHLDRLEHRQIKRLQRQRHQGRCVYGSKHARPAAGQLLKRLVV